MTIFLFGVSNVGKTTIGKLLASKLDYEFYDLDDEVKKYYGITLEEYVNTGTLEERDRKRGNVIQRIMKDDRNKVVAITPIAYPENFIRFLRRKDVLAIELIDTPENIFERLVFSDENDVEYHDDKYKNAHKDYYLHEICEDIVYYSRYSFAAIENKFDMHGAQPGVIVERIIKEYALTTVIDE